MNRFWLWKKTGTETETRIHVVYDQYKLTSCRVFPSCYYALSAGQLPTLKSERFPYLEVETCLAAHRGLKYL